MTALNTALPRASRLAVHRRVSLSMEVVTAMGTNASHVMEFHVVSHGEFALWVFLAF
jgi:hypothetical protein